MTTHETTHQSIHQSTDERTEGVPDARPDIVVEHSADGTVVTGTSRDDREVIDALKSNGFRWSRNLDAWYVPRPWGESTRLLRVRALVATLGDRVRVEVDDEPRRTAAEREADRQEAAANRADRMTARAAAAEARAAMAGAKADRIAERFAFGQPILVGHHSEPGARRDRDRIDAATRTRLDEARKADAARDAAARAERTAAGVESPVTIGNRIERNEAQLRKLQRYIDGSGNAVYGQHIPATGEALARLERAKAEVVDQIAHDRAKLAALGLVSYSRDNVKPGDFVKVRGAWYPVVRANAKTVTVPNPVLDADSTRTDTTPWREVAAHQPYDGVTAERIVELIKQTSPGLAGLRVRLARIARDLLDAEKAQAAEETGN